LKAQDVRWT